MSAGDECPRRMDDQAVTKILVVHGPNLNLLGVREPEVYGRQTLDEINGRLHDRAAARGVDLEAFQSNHEGALIDRIHEARGDVDFMIINPGGLTHVSVALRDALSASEIPVIEVHLSNIAAREEFRHRSLIAPIAVGSITGLGARSYDLAVEAALDRLAPEH